MTPDAAVELARTGRLYPSVILHGADDEARRAAALEIARTLLCAAEPGDRPCGACRHCRRLALAPAAETSAADAPFHPDFRAVERDLKTSTSVDSVREVLRTAQVSPFEARGQVFVVAAAETLSDEAGDALLKALEEPGTGAPRNFLLLAPSQFDLLPTLRSRSLAVYLGPAASLDQAEVDEIAGDFAACLAAWRDSGAAVLLLAAADALAAAGRGGDGWRDPRAGRPWSLAAAAVARAAAGAGGGEPAPAALRRRLLALASDLLEAAPFRLRGIPVERILEGLVFRHLAARAGGGE